MLCAYYCSSNYVLTLSLKLSSHLIIQNSGLTYTALVLFPDDADIILDSLLMYFPICSNILCYAVSTGACWIKFYCLFYVLS